MDSLDVKEWTIDTLIAQATWIVMEHVINGKLREGVYAAILLALKWKEAQK